MSHEQQRRERERLPARHDLTVVRGARGEIVVHGDPGRTPLTLHRAGRLVAGAKGALVNRKHWFSRAGMSAWTLPAGHYVARHGQFERKFEIVAGEPLRLDMGPKEGSK